MFFRVSKVIGGQVVFLDDVPGDFRNPLEVFELVQFDQFFDQSGFAHSSWTDQVNANHPKLSELLIITCGLNDKNNQL